VKDGNIKSSSDNVNTDSTKYHGVSHDSSRSSLDTNAIPYSFTTISDGHGHLFEMASMRVENEFNIEITASATMASLNNISSSTGAATHFADS
jgi:hypothetical protein